MCARADMCRPCACNLIPEHIFPGSPGSKYYVSEKEGGVVPRRAKLPISGVGTQDVEDWVLARVYREVSAASMMLRVKDTHRATDVFLDQVDRVEERNARC